MPLLFAYFVGVLSGVSDSKDCFSFSAKFVRLKNERKREDSKKIIQIATVALNSNSSPGEN